MFSQIQQQNPRGGSVEAPRFDVFLSHMSGDKPVVEALARLLKERGIEPWLDKWNLIPGEPWQEAIEQALRLCASCAVFLGPSGIGPWQNEEMRAAINRRVSRERGRFRVIPVLLPGAKRDEDSLPDFLTATTWVEFRDAIEDERALHRLICGIRGLEPGPDPGEAVAEGACPYRGLRFFDVDHARFFFGREALTERLIGKLRLGDPGGRFLAVVGPSGSGKSSLARAGLLASLKQGKVPGGDTWPVAICKPGAQPLQSLAVGLADAAGLGESPSGIRDLIRDLAADPSMLHLTTRLALRGVPADRRLVVLIDQFEEIFTLCSEEKIRRALIDNLLQAAIANDGQTVVLLTLRADFYGRCATYPDLAEMLSDHQVLIGSITRDELWQTIERPARLAGLTPESGLTDLLLKEIEDQPGCLPLLQHALLQIWERRQARRLTVAAYREIGGVTGALERHAEEIFGGFTESEREACRRLFLRLVQVDEAQGATKRRLAREALVSVADPEAERQAAETVLATLVNKRLLTAEAPGEEKRPTVELAHEALLTAWKRLRDWIDAGRQDLRIRRRLDEAVGEWLGSGREQSYLYIGARLAQAEEWRDRLPGELSPEAREFLAASVARRDEEQKKAEQRQQQEQAKQRRQRQRAMIAVSAVGVAAIVVAIAMFRLWRETQRQLQINLATQMTAQAEALLSSNPLSSLLLAAEAVRRAENLADAKGALLAALALSDAERLGEPGVKAITATADRRSLVTVSRDGAATIWTAGSSLPAGRTFPIEQNVESLALSSDRRWLLSEDRDGMIRLRDLARQTPPAEHLDELWPPGEPFSPDSRWLITRREDTPVLYDLQGGPSIREVQGVPPLQTVAFSPDSRRLAVALEGGRAEIWDLPDLTRRPLPGPPAEIGALAFSGDSRSLAAAVHHDREENARVWPLDAAGQAGQPVRLDGCTAYQSEKIAVSTDGMRVLTIGAGQASCLWTLNIRSRPFLTTWPPAEKAAFSAGGRWLARSDKAGAVLLLDLAGSPSPELTEQSRRHLFFVGEHAQLFFAGEGRWLVTQAGDEAPRLWDLRRYITGLSLAATPDGKRLVVDEPDGNLRLVERGGPSQVLRASEEPPSIWVFRADGSELAAGRGTLLRVWNFARGNLTEQKFPSPNPIRSLAFSPQDGRLAVGDGEFLWLWNPGQRAPRTVIHDPIQSVTALAFDRTATHLASGWQSGKTRIFRLDDPDLRLLDAQDGQAAVTALAFSPDGKWLAIADLDSAKLWQPSTNQRRLLDSGDKEARILAFSEDEDGRWLASGGEDGTLQLWDLDQSSGVPVTWKGHTGRVQALSFSEDGNELISTGATDTVRRWPLDPAEMIRLACQKARRNLTAEEWKTYAPPGEPFPQDTPCGQQ